MTTRKTRAQQRADEIYISPVTLLAQIDELAGQLVAAGKQSDEYLLALQRERAEFLNFKRRTAEERERDLGLAGDDLIRKVLAVADDFDRRVEIGHNVVLTVSSSGAKAFTAAGGRDIFGDIDALNTALSTNDVTGLQATVNTLDIDGRQLIAARIDAGLKVARLDTYDNAHQETQLSLSKQLQSLVAVDPASAYSSFVQAGTAVEQALAVSKRMLDTLGNRLG